MCQGRECDALPSHIAVASPHKQLHSECDDVSLVAGGSGTEDEGCDEQARRGDVLHGTQEASDQGEHRRDGGRDL